MSEERDFIGLDLSLTGTGFAFKRGSVVTLDTIKTVPKDFANDLDRLIHIRDSILGQLHHSTALICIEDFFTPQNSFQIGAAISLAMLGTAVRLALHERQIPFVIVSPPQVKKFVTGKGVGQKSMILKEVYKRWGIEAKDDNQADACVLAHIAEALIDGYNDQTPKFQVEVIDKVRADRPRYNVKAPWAVKVQAD